MLIRQLKYGETVAERIDAARLLRTESPSKDDINSIKDSITNDRFYGVSLECLDTIVAYATYDKITDEEIRSFIYKTVESFFDENKTNSVSSIEDKRVVSSLLNTFSQFTKFHNKKSLDLINPFINNTNWFIARSAIAALGKITSNLIVKEKEDEDGLHITIQEKKI